MSARQNIRSAHAELKKTIEDGGILKGAKERNKCLTPGDPQSCHVLSTALGEHLASLDLDVAVHVTCGVVCSEIQAVSLHLRPSRSNCQTFFAKAQKL